MTPPEEVAAPAPDVAHDPEAREVVGGHHACHLAVRLGRHGGVEDAGLVGMLREARPEAAGENLLRGWVSGSRRMSQLPVDGPVHRQAEHPHQRPHRTRMVGSQEPRRRGVPARIPLQLEHAVSGQETQDAAQGLGVGADRGREIGHRAGTLVEGVGDAQVGDHVKASREGVPARDLEQPVERIGFPQQGRSSFRRRRRRPAHQEKLPAVPKPRPPIR